jgi:hypothetical protein
MTMIKMKFRERAYKFSIEAGKPFDPRELARDSLEDETLTNREFTNILFAKLKHSEITVVELQKIESLLKVRREHFNDRMQIAIESDKSYTVNQSEYSLLVQAEQAILEKKKVRMAKEREKPELHPIQDALGGLRRGLKQ